jgi:hypothetical protein
MMGALVHWSLAKRERPACGGMAAESLKLGERLFLKIERWCILVYSTRRLARGMHLRAYFF